MFQSIWRWYHVQMEKDLTSIWNIGKLYLPLLFFFVCFLVFLVFQKKKKKLYLPFLKVVMTTLRPFIQANSETLKGVINNFSRSIF